MVLVVLVIGINLLNSYEKMKKFDKSLSSIAMEISNISEKEKDIQTSDGVVSVNKLSGDVYPTQEETSEETSADDGTSSAASESASPEDSEDEDGSADENNGESESSQTQDAASTQTVYVVQKGDTIMSICKRFYGNTEKLNEIIELNKLEDANKLYIGQEIKLP